MKVRVLQTFGEPRATTNPYIVMLRNALVASHEVDHLPFRWTTALLGSYDVVHIHWPDALLAARTPVRRMGKRLVFVAFLCRLRRRRIPVVRTVHNLRPPDLRPLDRLLVRCMEQRREVDICINDTTPARDGVPSVLIRHGHYRDWFATRPHLPPVPDRLVYVGLIKPYKGVDQLITAFDTARSTRGSLTLRIAGDCSDPALAAQILAAAARLDGLEATLRYVDEDEFAGLVTSGVLVVLPYHEMHNSGSVLAALSLDRPVLVPDTPANRALAEEVGPGWVHFFRGALRADDLLAAIDSAQRTPTARPDLSARGWSDAAAAHAAAYRLACDRLARGLRRPARRPHREDRNA